MSAIARPGKSSELRAQYRIAVCNASGEVIPAWACLQISAAPVAGAEETYTVIKPNGASTAKYLLNGPQEIAVGGYGAATDTFPAVALWAGGVAPSTGVEWGPAAGSWRLSSSGQGFLVLGGVTGSEDGTVRVASIAPGADRRIIRGQVVSAAGSGDATFEIDHVVALASGYDPTGGVSSTTIEIENIHGESWSEDETAYAEYNALSAVWEARKKAGGGPRFVAITAGFDGASWNSSTGVKTNETITVYPFVSSGADTETIDAESPIDVTIGLGVAITVAEGKFRVGTIIDGVLLNVQCDEWSLVEDWDEE